LHPYFYNPKLSSGHTWRKYCQIVSEIKAMELGFDKENSFLNHCFITEMNHVPSKPAKEEYLFLIEKVITIELHF